MIHAEGVHATGELVTTFLVDGDVDRLDALAQHYGLTREVMLGVLVDAGFKLYEETAAPPESVRRAVGSTS